MAEETITTHRGQWYRQDFLEARGGSGQPSRQRQRFLGETNLN